MSAGHRQAAAALYGHGDIDREAVLGALPEADRTVLRQHLAEMAALGFERTPLDRDAIRAGDAAQVQTPAQRLQAASAGQLFEALGGEPSPLIALFLDCGPWPAEAALLALLEPERRRQVATAREAADGVAAAAAPALRAALLDAVAGALPPAAPAGLARSRGWHIGRRVTGWMRWGK